MVEVEFIYKQQITIVQCELNNKIGDIYKRFISKVGIDINSVYFLYSGNKIDNNELTIDKLININDREIKKMKIIVESINQIEINEALIESNEIICPKCKEKAMININNYNIKIYGCKNNHIIDNILFENFENLQMIDISKILCEECKINNKKESYENKFNYCLNCKKNICVTCKIKHDKNHKIIDYENKDYICNNHNEGYIRYCEDCKINLCIYCESKHNNHNTINIMPDLDKIKNNIKELKENIDIFNNNIEKIINKLMKVKENIKIYYKIYNNIYNNYEKRVRNYELFYNINEMNNNNIIKEIKKINNENNIKNKIINIIDI